MGEGCTHGGKGGRNMRASLYTTTADFCLSSHTVSASLRKRVGETECYVGVFCENAVCNSCGCMGSGFSDVDSVININTKPLKSHTIEPCRAKQRDKRHVSFHVAPQWSPGPATHPSGLFVGEGDIPAHVKG